MMYGRVLYVMGVMGARKLGKKTRGGKRNRRRKLKKKKD